VSPSIWTRCAGASRIARLADRAWRAVEAQHVVSTAKLADSPEEQAALERLIDTAKPPLLPPEEFAGLHFLLTTSFRYPPLRHGSRFASRLERSLWYGSRKVRTVFAEVAYYRLLFLEGTTADIGRLEVDLSLFSVPLRTRRGVDLTRGPFAEFTAEISSPTSYTASQGLGQEMRAAGVEAFRYRSARDSEGGLNLALFTPRAFAARRPATPRTWHCAATRERVDFVRKDALERAQFCFPRREFLVRNALPRQDSP
jgi:hypothetical protein